MLKINFFIVVLLLAQLCQGQTLTLEGIVNQSNSSKSLPYVSIGVKGSTKGTVTDLSGKFFINVTSSDTLVFSTIGFTPKIIAVSEFKSPVILEEEIVKLNEVVVHSGKQINQAILGNTKAKTRFLFGGSNQYALLLKNDKKTEGILEELIFNVQPDLEKDNHYETIFKLRLYKNENNYPGQDLLTESITVVLKKKEKKIFANVSDLGIVIRAEGLFIGIDLLGFIDEKKSFIPYNRKKTPLNLRIQFSEGESFITYGKFFGTDWKKVATQDRNGNSINVSAKFGAKVSY